MLTARPVSAVIRRTTDSARRIRLVLSTPGARPIALTSLVARLPKGMTPLALVLLLHQSTGSYAVAGATVALVAAGDAATAPGQGRLVDRFGRGRVLLPTAALHAAAVAGLIWVADIQPTRDAYLIGCAVIVGVGLPPISGTIKTAWSELIDHEHLPAAYTVESLLQQVFFLSGPLLVAAAAAWSGPAFALGLSAALVVGGTVGFVLATRTIARRRPTGRGRSALRSPAVRVLTVSTLLQSVTFGALPVGLVGLSTAAHRPALSGILLATLTTGGLLGTFGPPAGGDVRQYPRLVAGFAVLLGVVAPLGLMRSGMAFAAVGAALIGAGLFLTPIAAGSYVLVERATAPGHRTEAFAWLSTGQAVGNAAGSALAGILLDGAGSFSALALPGVAAALAAVVSRRGLRHRLRSERPG